MQDTVTVRLHSITGTQSSQVNMDISGAAQLTRLMTSWREGDTALDTFTNIPHAVGRAGEVLLTIPPYGTAVLVHASAVVRASA